MSKMNGRVGNIKRNESSSEKGIPRWELQLIGARSSSVGAPHGDCRALPSKLPRGSVKSFPELAPEEVDMECCMQGPACLVWHLLLAQIQFVLK